MAKKDERKEQTQLEPIKLGIIGSGLAVKWLHWPALKDLPGHFKIVATCDTVAESRAEIAGLAQELNKEQYGDDSPIRQYADYRELLAWSEVEAVLLSLPIHLNAEIMLDSALAGKHILCEKPIAANLPQAKRLVTALSDVIANRKLVVEIAENYHYRQELDQAKKWAFEDKRIGEVVMISANSIFRMDSKKGFAQTPWRIDNQYRGGIVADGGVHYSALLRHLGGEVEQLQAFGKMMHPEATSSLDSLIVNLRFKNGILGLLTYSAAVAVPEKEIAEAYIYGTQGMIRVNRNQARLYFAGEDGEVKEQERFEATLTGYYLEFLNFYEAVRSGKPVIATIDEGLRDFEIIMRAFDSAEERSVILFS